MLGFRKAALFAVSFFAATATCSKVAHVPRSFKGAARHEHLHALRAFEERAAPSANDVGTQIQTLLTNAESTIKPLLAAVNASVLLAEGAAITEEVVHEIEAKLATVSETLNTTLTSLLALEADASLSVCLDVTVKAAIALQLQLILEECVTVAASLNTACGGHLTGSITLLLKVFKQFKVKIQVIIGEILCCCERLCVGLKVTLTGMLGWLTDLIPGLGLKGITAKLHIQI